MVAIKSVIACSIMILLFGCSSKQDQKVEYIEKPIYIEVPVLQTPQITPIKKPSYYLLDLNESSSAQDVAEAYVNTIKQMNAYIKQLENAVVPFYKDQDNDK